MKHIVQARAGLWAALCLSLAACGGGGSDEPDTGGNNGGLCTLQQEFQASVTEGSFAITTSLPAAGLPTPGLHHAFSTRLAVTNRLSPTPQLMAQTLAPLSGTLPLPDFNTGTARPRW